MEVSHHIFQVVLIFMIGENPVSQNFSIVLDFSLLSKKKGRIPMKQG